MAVWDLQAMLRGMEPVLTPQPYGIIVTQSLPAGLVPFATVAEAEGLTVIAAQDALAAAGVAGGAHWALISLRLHSDLAAVGLTAAIATALADLGISANVVAGYFHDHILVPWDRAQEAMTALQRVSDA